jgi:ectoine hydroxylase-related dioxygenase (phytanoyl-CoA dioxygenase family)
MQESLAELRDSGDAVDDGTELRRRIAADGYLFFRNLLDPELVRALRRDILTAIGKAGWLAPDRDIMEGIADVGRRCTEGDQEYISPYCDVQRLESFHRFPHDATLVGVVERVLDSKTIPIPGHKARIWFPKFTDHTTPMHQDFVHYQGSLDTLTTWIPVGDCPIELGPLAVLEGSHKVRKVLPHHFALGAGNMAIDLESERARYPQLSGRWVSADFRAGDALFFPANTIHRALPNVTDDRMRISLDNRYQREGGRIAEHMLVPHLVGDRLSWAEIYEGWESDDLKYYWLSRPHRKIKLTTTFGERVFEEMKDLGRQGDPRALLALKRILDAAGDAEPPAEIAEILASRASDAGPVEPFDQLHELAVEPAEGREPVRHR